MPTTNEAVLFKSFRLPTDRPRPEIERKRVIGERAMVSILSLKGGCVVEPHSHDNEQIAFILEGRMRFTTGEGGAERILTAERGDIVSLPAGVRHGAVALEDSRVLDVFAPPSEGTGIDAPAPEAAS